MSTTRKVVFCFNGTYSTNNATPNSVLGKLASSFMYHPNNLLTEIFTHCLEPYKFHLDGPGSDLCHDGSGSWLSKVVGTVLGGMDGHFGINSIENNLKLAKEILLNQATLAKEANQIIELHVFSYSRGSFLAWRLKKDLSQLISEHRLPICALHMINVDPVAGALPDRLRLFLYRNQEDPTIETSSTTYFSHTGNLHIWPFRWNTTFFSGLLVDEGIKSKKRWLVKANHEGIAGRLGHKDNHPEKNAGLAVLGDIIQNATLQFEVPWRQQMIATGLNALTKCEAPSVHNRAYLSPKGVLSCFIGERRNHPPLTEKNLVESIEDFEIDPILTRRSVT